MRVEDFPDEQRSWLPRLFIPLNQFLTFASAIINGQIQFGPNIPSQDNVLSFTYDGSVQRYRWNISFTPNVLWVGQAYENSVAVALIPTWAYDSSSGNISVSFSKVGGAALTSGSVYKIFVRAVP